jgi:4-amino-4-deoxy-L-arabinose transferase-like glycosyltransferase
LFGEKAGLLSLFFFVFCPNLNGNAILLSTDAYTALIVVCTAYYFWKFIKRSGWKNFLYFCISLGIAQIVKYSMVHLLIIFGLASLFVLIKRKTIFNSKNIIRLVVMGVIILFIINVGYLFNNTGRSLQDFKLSSHTFSSLQNSFVGKIPLPVPGPYIEGIDLTTYINELGAGDPNVSDANYIFGEKRTGTGFWYYYPGMLTFKTPLLVLMILISGMLFLVLRKPKQGHPSTMLFLLFFIFYFLLVLGFQNNVQIGVRHVLMIYPLLYVLAGFIVTLPWFQARQKIFVPVLVLYSLATYYYFFPNLLSYSNEFIIDKKSAYKVMADSNLDYGQGIYALEKYLRSHPDVSAVTKTPAQGKFVIRINDYLNLKGNNDYAWIETYKPVAQIDHCFLLIDTNDLSTLKK